jgi:ATP-binding protein involved in chromosome partitioning
MQHLEQVRVGLGSADPEARTGPALLHYATPAGRGFGRSVTGFRQAGGAARHYNLAPAESLVYPMSEDAVLAAVKAALDRYVDPFLGDTLGSAQAVRSIETRGPRVVAKIALGFPVGGYAAEFAAAVGAFLRANGIDTPVDVELESDIRAHSVQKQLKPLSGIKNIVAVASGKGGVGKSTVAANLALAWAAQGARVGLLDADIYGPSQPLMLGLEGQRPGSPDGKTLTPLQSHGVTAMSIGFLVDAEQPMVWRGPMVTQALTQLLSETHWGELDYLVVDMPPGTGDIQLTLSQRVPVSGAVIVTTPQDIALADAIKGLKMFEKVSVPVLGIIENMSLHVCSSCGHVEHIFGAGGGARMAEQYGVRLLGELPLDAKIREEADGGRPTVVAAPDTPRAKAYLDTARRTAGALARRARDRSSLFPKIVVEES